MRLPGNRNPASYRRKCSVSKSVKCEGTADKTIPKLSSIGGAPGNFQRIECRTNLQTEPSQRMFLSFTILNGLAPACCGYRSLSAWSARRDDVLQLYCRPTLKGRIHDVIQQLAAQLRIRPRTEPGPTQAPATGLDSNRVTLATHRNPGGPQHAQRCGLRRL